MIERMFCRLEDFRRIATGMTSSRGTSWLVCVSLQQ
ncbi:MAG: hypothetical protein K0S56_1832 [Microvirga sp.]|jgi:hypothetical protein|nr:hypothetical protein [Microvirga sp.]